MLNSIKKSWPLFLSLFIYAVIIGSLISDSIQRNAGHFIYALDDPYIHMAIAKNFALHGVWGITADGFSSSTSAPLWTLLLAGAYRLFGVNDLTPLVMNILAAAALLGLVFRFLSRCVRRSWIIFLLLATILFATPLPAQTMTGMEHLLHALITVWFGFTAARALTANHPAPFRQWLPLILLAPLLTGIRYEGIFLIGAVVVLLLIRKQFRAAVGVGAAGMIPPVLYGWVSLSQGWLFFPNSLLLKAGALHTPPAGLFSKVFNTLVEQTSENSAVLSLLLLSLILWIVLASQADAQSARSLIQLFAIAALAHLAFSDLGWFYRYEAYLVPLGLTAVGSALTLYLEAVKIRIRLDSSLPYAVMLLLVTLVSVFWPRSGYSLRDTVSATTNIYEQQVQMAQFAQRFYAGQAVAANDIGAINYYASIRTLDLFGLGSLEPARLKLAVRYDTAQIERLVREKNVTLIMVYDPWFEEFGGLPRSWIKVGEWEISNNVVCGYPIVSFYAPTQAARGYLKNSLILYSSQLPRGVQWKIIE